MSLSDGTRTEAGSFGGGMAPCGFHRHDPDSSLGVERGR